MSDKKVISFDEYVADDDITVEEVETKRGTIVKMGSCSSEDILEWFEENDAVLEDGKPDHDKRKYKGLRLIVRALINADGSRIPKEMRPSAIAALKKHDSRENSRLMAAAFRVNGLRVVGAPAVPNASSGAASGASLTDSPSQPEK